MAAVQLAVANELLPHFETIRTHIGGPEISRRPSQDADDVTIVTLDMDEASDQAAIMEIALQHVHGKGSRILNVTYYDIGGRALATIERSVDRWIQPT